MKILLLLLSYLIGSIPTGYWFAKYFFGIDVTKNGSKNIGATNVARVLGSKKYFFLIFAIDFLKAFLTLFSIYYFVKNIEYMIIAASLLLIGNAHSLFMNFRGGKGVATALGILAFLLPKLLFVCLITWTTVLFFARRVDVASLTSFLVLIPAYFILYTNGDRFSIATFLIFMVSWIFLRHKNNIKELIA